MSDELPPLPNHPMKWGWSPGEEKVIRAYAEQYAQAKVAQERERAARLLELDDGEIANLLSYGYSGSPYSALLRNRAAAIRSES